MPRQSPLRRSERASNRHFASSHAGTGKQKIGNVDAGNQENQSDGGQEQHQRLANVANHPLFKRQEPNGPRVLWRVITGNCFCKDAVSASSLLLRYGNCSLRASAGLLPSEDNAPIPRWMVRHRRARKNCSPPKFRCSFLPQFVRARRKPAGITPTIRYKSVSIRTLLPRIFESAPEERFQSPSLMTTSGIIPGE